MLLFRVLALLPSAMVADPKKLLDEIHHLIRSPRLRADMANHLHQEARADAAKRLAKITLEEA